MAETSRALAVAGPAGSHHRLASGRALGSVQVGDVAAQQVARGHLKGGVRAARGGPAEQVPVLLVGHRLALVGQHDRYAVTNAVAAAQPRVVQDAVLGQV